MASFGERLRELRLNHNLTQQDLADLLGTTKISISDYERGRRRPAGEHALEAYELLADRFNVDLEYLLGVRDETMILRLSADECDLMCMYRQASDDTKAAVRAILCFQNKGGLS